MSGIGAKVRKVVWPLGMGIAFLLFWQLGGVHAILHFKIFQLPVPSVILQTVVQNFPKMLSDTWVTVSGALTGMLNWYRATPLVVPPLGEAPGAVPILAIAWAWTRRRS